MSNKLYLVAFIVLILASGGIAYVVKKQLDKKKKQAKIQTPKATTEETTTEEPKGARPRQLENVAPKLEIESSIDVEFVDTVNRTFSYNLNYNGIGTSGTFKDGDPDKLLTKSFGSFSIKQEEPEAAILPPTLETKGTKMGGSSSTTTKGGATKTGKINGATTKGGASKLVKMGNNIYDFKTQKLLAIMKPSDLVYLSINDEHGALHSLTVNLATGAKVGSKAPRNWDGN